MIKKFLTICAAAVMILGCAEKTPVLTKSGLNPDDFKAERDGAPIALYTLTNKAGMEVCVTNFGGRIVSAMVPDRNGEFKDVELGFDNIQDYFPENNQTDFGATIGRYANRLAVSSCRQGCAMSTLRRSTTLVASVATTKAALTMTSFLRYPYQRQ